MLHIIAEFEGTRADELPAEAEKEVTAATCAGSRQMPCGFWQ